MVLMKRWCVFFLAAFLTLAASALAQTQMVTLFGSVVRPNGVATDRAGNAYFAAAGNNAILKWNVSTHEIVPLLHGTNIVGIAIDGFGNVSFTDDFEHS